MNIEFAFAQFQAGTFVPVFVRGQIIDIAPQIADLCTLAVAREPAPAKGRWWTVFIVETGATFSATHGTKRGAIRYAWAVASMGATRTRMLRHMAMGDPLAHWTPT